MQLSKKNILAVLKELDGAIPFAGLLREFGGRHVKHELKRMLDDMADDGEIVRFKGNSYSLAATPKSIRGTLSTHRDGYGFVTPEGGGEDIFIPQRHMKSAMHGDTVEVRAERSRMGGGKQEGRITAVTQRASARIVGRYEETRRGAIVIPEETRLNLVVAIPPQGRGTAEDGQQVVAELTSYHIGGRPAEGRVVEVLGWPDDPEVEVQSAIRRFDLPHIFGKDSLAEAEAVPDAVSKEELKGRVDLRGMVNGMWQSFRSFAIGLSLSAVLLYLILVAQFRSFKDPLLIMLAIPIILQNIMSASLNFIDNIMVGRLGDTEIAAVGLANQVYFIVLLFLLGVNGGASMFISQFWGKNDIKNIHRVQGLSLMLGISACILIVIPSIAFPDTIMSILSKDPKVIVLGSSFLRISSMSYILFGVSSMYSVALRNTGYQHIPMTASIIAVIANTTLNYLLIFGNFGFPRLGVPGAAIATCIARVLECTIILSIVYSHKWPSSAKIRSMLDQKKKLIRRFFHQSGLLIFKDVLWAVGIIIYMGIYSRIGTSDVAAINILNPIIQISTVILSAFQLFTVDIGPVVEDTGR